MLILNKNYLLNCLLQIVICIIIVFSAVTARFFSGDQFGLFSYLISPDMNILGRTLVISNGIKTTLILFYSFLGLWSLCLYIFKKKSLIVPLGLTFTALLIASMAVEPFMYSALILEIAVLVSVPMVADVTRSRIRGISRYIIYFTIGMPFVLLAGWYLAGGEINPVNEDQLIQAALLLGLGFIFWLAVFPFQSWVPMLSQESEPSEGLLILNLLQISIIFLLLKYLNGFAWLRSYSIVFEALRIFGLILIVFGSLWFSLQESLKKGIGYLILVSSGLIILAISLNTSNGYIISSYLILLRTICFFVIAWILSFLEKESEDIFLDSIDGLFFERPIIAISLFISLFSLVGMPLTPGYPIYQIFLSEVTNFNSDIKIILIICLFLLSITFIKWVFKSLNHSDETGFKEPELPINLFFIISNIFYLLVGIFPNRFFLWISEIVSDLQFLVR